jgi:GNAT superfamily N-acetyltransferase
MTYSCSCPAPEINRLPPGFVVSKMRVRDFRAWFVLMHKSELVWSFCLDGLVKFFLDRRFSRYPTFLIWWGTQLVASASLWDKKNNSNRMLMVHMVAVDPETRGMGLGTHVTCLVIDYLRRELSVQHRIWLQASGIQAQRFYEKNGFSVVSGTEVAD